MISGAMRLCCRQHVPSIQHTSATCLLPSKRTIKSTKRAAASDKQNAAVDSAAAAAAVTLPTDPYYYSYIMPRQAVAMFAAGLTWSFESCWWVPLLFGLAGSILGVGVPILDRLQEHHHAQDVQQHHEGQATSLVTPQPPPAPSWPAVLLCISLFVTQYGLSGRLEQTLLGATLPGTTCPAEDLLLFLYAVALWALFDRSPQGFGMAALTAVCGPVVEMVLINRFGLYHYTHPVVLGVPTWIPWVYFAGGPAVGNLGRHVWQQLATEHQQQQQQQHQQQQQSEHVWNPRP